MGIKYDRILDAFDGPFENWRTSRRRLRAS